MKGYIFKIKIILSLLILSSCAGKYYVRQNFNYPKKVNTQDKKITFQNKKVYQIGSIFADNRFDGARLNHFTQVNDSTYQALIAPENTPINHSPWYAFKIWSTQPDTIYIQLKYVHAKHRYDPKISRDRKNWKAVTKFIYNTDSTAVTFKLPVSTQPEWVAAQKIINSADTRKWIESLKENPLIYDAVSLGKSVLNKDIPFFKIGTGTTSDKKIIVLLSRQHPPEVTGFMALQSFVNELLQNNPLTQAFYKKYEVWVCPLINPDGVDLGHWRHNAHGVDLNRDWAVYNQPETRAVTGFLINELAKHRNKLILGIDFHATFKDVYYVFNDSFHTVLPDFNKYWTTAIDHAVYPFHTKISPFGATQAISKNWFYKQFKAEGITYEVGDKTPEKMIAKKAAIAADNMMSLLIYKK